MLDVRVGKDLHLICFFFSAPLPAVCVQILDEGQLQKQHHWQNRSITEWTSQQVARWLMALNLEHHIPEFTVNNIDGEQLLQLESAELKVSSKGCIHASIKMYIREGGYIGTHVRQ